MNKVIDMPVMPEDVEVLNCKHCGVELSKKGNIKFFREERGGKTFQVVCQTCWDKGMRY